MAESALNIEQHIKYWRRCLTTFLPTQYTSTDSSRMTLGFFILSALDLLGAGADTFSEQERSNIRTWVLDCQHPVGGFCGSPNHKFPSQCYTDVGGGPRLLDPPNLPATFFALLSLSFVDGLDQVNKSRCLRWLKSLQRRDGSFGELASQNGKVEGGRDMRYCYVAAAVRWILRGYGETESEDDIDVDGLVNFLRSGQTYDGGISESSEHEAHAGYTYCAVAALSLLGRGSHGSSSSSNSKSGLTNIPETIRWLLSRQMSYEQQPDSDEEEEEETKADQSPSEVMESDHFVGFNGRCNKVADTCYAFWVGGSLDVLGLDVEQLINVQSARRFLYQQTQHRIGGFGKYPGSPPDIYHSYLGLAALAVLKEPGLKPLDSALCVSVEQRQKVSELRKLAETQTSTYWKNGYLFNIRARDPDFEAKLASGESPPQKINDILLFISKKRTTITS